MSLATQTYERLFERLGEIRRDVLGPPVARPYGYEELSVHRYPETQRREYYAVSEEIVRRNKARQKEVSRKVRSDAQRARRERERAAAKARSEANALVTLFDSVVPVGYDPDTDNSLSSKCVVAIVTGKIPRIRVILTIEGEVVIDKEVVFDKWNRKDVYTKIRVALAKYEYSAFQVYPSGDPIPEGSRIRLVILPPTQLPIEALIQRFRDGGVHCVCDPLIEKFESNLLLDNNDDTHRRICERLEVLKRWRSEWNMGIPEDKMEELAKAIHYKLILKDILTKTVTTWNNKPKLPVFSFTNTRPNHVEPGTMMIMDDPRTVSREFIQNEYERCCNENVAYMAKKGDDGIRFLATTTCAMRADNPFYQAVNTFKTEQQIADKGLQAGKYPELNAFLQKGCVVNSCPMKVSGGVATHVLDMKKAYTRHKECTFYRGFPGKIHTWGRIPNGVNAMVFLKENLGDVAFRVLDGDMDLLRRLRFTKNNVYILPTPEVLFLITLGFRVKLIEGAFGKRFDFTWPDTMLEPIGSPEDWWYVKKPYAQVSGILGMNQDSDTWEFQGPPEFVSHLTALGTNAWGYSDGLAKVTLPRENYTTYHHIYSFILSYTRITMIQAMLRFDLKNIVGVELDGIHYTGTAPSMEGLPEFAEKKAKPVVWKDFGWYEPTAYVPATTAMIQPKMLHNVLLRGAGGTGKTYSVLTNPTVLGVVYVVPTRELGQRMHKEHGVQWITIHRLLGKGCEAWKLRNGEPARILMDELTMLDGDWVTEALEMYPNSVFAIAGDVRGTQHYQCRNGTSHIGFGKLWYGEDWPVIDHTKDYRAANSLPLVKMKLHIRRMMDYAWGKEDNGGPKEAQMVSAMIRKAYNVVPFDEAVKMFVPGDTWIAGCKSTNERLLKHGVVSVQEDTANEKKAQGSRTIHSSQGDTIREGKVFVSIHDAFEYAMVYTAVARCVQIEQLVLVG